MTISPLPTVIDCPVCENPANSSAHFDKSIDHGVQLLTGVLETDSNRHPFNDRYAGRFTK
jgi:hypothetical protein